MRTKLKKKQKYKKKSGTLKCEQIWKNDKKGEKRGTLKKHANVFIFFGFSIENVYLIARKHSYMSNNTFMT